MGDVDQRCRMCAKIVQDEGLSLLDSSQQELVDWINDYLQFKIDDDLPTKICIPCKVEIENCINFKKRCNVAHNQFSSNLSNQSVNPPADDINTKQQHTFLDKWLQSQNEITKQLNFEGKNDSDETIKIPSKDYEKLLSKYNIRESYVRLELLSQNLINKYIKDTKNESGYLSSQLNTIELTDSSSEGEQKGGCDEEEGGNLTDASTVIAPVFPADSDDSGERSRLNIETRRFTRQDSENCHRPLDESLAKHSHSSSQQQTESMNSEANTTGSSSQVKQQSKSNSAGWQRKKSSFGYSRRQKSENQNSNLYDCEYVNCNAAFLSKSGRSKHYAKYHPNKTKFTPKYNIDMKKYTCKYCDLKFFYNSGLYKHVSKKHPQPKRSYLCVVCNKSFPFMYKLRTHIKMSHPEYRPFTCHHCNNKYQDKDNLTRHIQSVHVDPSYKCGVCKALYKTKALLQYHIKTHSSVRPFQCALCDKSYIEKILLLNHICSHLGIRPYHCDICKKSFVTNGELSSHKLIHSNEKPFKCPQCGKGFKTACYLKQHAKTVHSYVAKFKCPKCPSTFTLRSNMHQHLKRMHASSWDFKCETCAKLFRTKGELVSHSLVHTNERPFKCNQCKLACKTKILLRDHIKNVHSDNRPFVCPQCKKGFKYKQNLTEHLKGVHGTERNFQCPKCDKTFALKGTLKSHFLIHENNQYHTCKYCAKTFNYLSNFRRHIKTVHEKILLYNCHVCKKKLVSKCQLKIHMVSHIDERNVECDICSNKFKTMKALTRHKRRVHIDNRPFTCNTCGKSFKTKAELRSHVRYHLGLRSFKCETCGSKFISSSNWREHVLRMHKHVLLYECKQCNNVAFRLYADLRKHMKENHYESI